MEGGSGGTGYPFLVSTNYLPFKSPHRVEQRLITCGLRAAPGPQITVNLLLVLSYQYSDLATGRIIGFRFPARAGIFSSLPHPDRLWGPPSLISNGYRWLFPRCKAAEARS
jgi:hypothetical protein